MAKHIQKAFFLKLIFLILIVNSGCDKWKDFEAGNPDQIVQKAVKLYNEKNADKFIRLFSKDALKKMDHSLQALRMQFKTLEPQYRHDLAEKMNMDPKSLANLSMADYVLFNMNIQSGGMGSDNVIFPVKETVADEYVGTDEKGDRAIVKYEHTTIELVKEKKFWKINTFEIKAEKSAPNPDSDE